MMSFFTGNALWQLIKQSDAVSKFVMLLLLGMSIICWTLFLYKLLALRVKKKQMKLALVDLKNTATIEQMLALAATHTHTAPGYFLAKNLTFLKLILEDNRLRESRPMTTQQWNLIEQTIQQTVDDMIDYEESGLAFLSASAAIAPLLGLFGTVWGLVHSFISISEKQSADITTVAPGLAEALMTTLAGLMVAIPALIMFHYLSLQIARFGTTLMAIADRFNFVVQKLFFW
jgi:biopolymer transport protein ExbB/TolQ